VPLPIAKENGYSARFRIGHDDIGDTVVIDVSYGDCIRIAANRNHNGGELRASGALNLSRA